MPVNCFAERFRRALAENNISQNMFAKKYNFGQKTVNSWCLGLHEPNIDTLILIADELNVSIDYLVGRE